MKKYILGISVISSILLSGCATSNSMLKKDESFIKYNNNEHTIGNKENAIKTLTFHKTINGENDYKITFYIDKFPYHKEFNLCTDQSNFKRLKSVTTYKNKKDKLTYEDIAVDCNGYINVFKNKYVKGLSGNYKLKLLNGFNIAKLKGHDMKLESTTIHEVSTTMFEDFAIESKGSNTTKYFWTIK
ncbi:hypothetical protein [Malaciobacter marinus]|uniref:hypothetical protein n=1 Tax=Malaciobacter marinus TaxID=505249 RepID=UPI003B002960